MTLCIVYVSYNFYLTTPTTGLKITIFKFSDISTTVRNIVIFFYVVDNQSSSKLMTVCDFMAYVLCMFLVKQRE